VEKSKLARITKRGDTYLRTLLIQAAKSAVQTAHPRSDKISDWLLKLRERSGWQIAAVALANKNARILWAIMTKGEDFDVNHRIVKPAGSTQPAQATYTVFIAAGKAARCSDRSDRRRASSTNPWCERQTWQMHGL